MKITIQFCLILVITFCFSVTGFSQDTNESSSFKIGNEITRYLYFAPNYANGFVQFKSGLEFNRKRSSVFTGLRYGASIHDPYYNFGAEIGYKYSFVTTERFNVYLKSPVALSYHQSNPTNVENFILGRISVGPGFDYKVGRFTVGAGALYGFNHAWSVTEGQFFKPGHSKFWTFNIDWINLQYRLGK